MSPQEFERKLTAILSADVEGYSRLMGEDEDNTVRTLTSYRKLISSLIERYNGRVVDSPGDNLLAEFGSVRDAVRCAVEIQEELRISNADFPENRKMQFRIGINLGDVIKDGDRIYGDGINVAARVESLAEGGGISISGTVYDSIRNKLSMSYEFMGEHSVKNIKNPIRIYRIQTEPEAETPIMKEEKTSTLSNKPSIAVLPFIDLSPEKDQEYFVDGLSEEILNGLCQIADLGVAGRTSCFSFKGSNKTIQEISSILKVDNVLEGSVRKAGSKLRITAQLVDAVDGLHLWSKTYDRELKDIFEVQEDIALRVADELKVTLGIGKTFKQLGGTDNLEAYELYLIANAQRYDLVKLQNEATKSIEAALDLEPEFASAWALKSLIHENLAIFGPSNRADTERDTAISSAQRAIEIEPKLALGYLSLGICETMRGKWVDAELRFHTALQLQTEISHPAGTNMAVTYIAAGHCKKGCDILEKYRRNDPLNIATRAIYVVVLSLIGDKQKIKNENELCKGLFGDLWKLRSYGMAYYLLSTGDPVSRHEIEYSSLIFDAAKEYLDSPREGLAKLHQLYSDENNLSGRDITDISLLAAYFGDPEFAMDAMEKGNEINASGFFKIWYPVMREVRQLPRFKEFVKEIGLVDYWNRFGWPDLCRPLGDDDFVCD